jgi:hypothetical protein
VGAVNTDIHEVQVKAARNQSLFREVNERVQQLKRDVHRWSEIDFVCECADEACMAPISMPVSEYEEVRRHAERFFVRPQHLYPEVEVVLAKNDRYWTVEKIEDAAPVAAALDARRATEAAA